MTKPFIYWIRFATMVTVTTFGSNQPIMAARPKSERSPCLAAIRPSVACQEALLQGCIAMMVATCWSGPQRLEPLQHGSRQLQGDRTATVALGLADATETVELDEPLKPSQTLLASHSWLGTGISSIACFSTLVHAEFPILHPSPRSTPRSAACCSEDHRLELGASIQPEELLDLCGIAEHRAEELSGPPRGLPSQETTYQKSESIQTELLENPEQHNAEHPIASADRERWEVSEIPSVAPPEFHDACAQGMAPDVAWLFGTPPEAAHASDIDLAPDRQHAVGLDSHSSESMIAESSQSADALESEWASRVFRGAEYREWMDNTGTYRVQARVAVIFEDRVRLLKDTGKITTVPLTRLSSRDRAYVLWVATSLSARAQGGLQR